MSPSDGALEARRERFRQAAGAVQEPVFRYVRRRASREIADDVVADTLLVLWRRLDEVVDGNEVAFCLGVARRSLANHVRSSTRHLRLVGRLTATTPPSAFHAPAADDARENPELREALASLPRGERELLTLWAWERLEAREIAVVLDITANAASIRLHRAKQHLRDELQRKNLCPAEQSGSGDTETR